MSLLGDRSASFIVRIWREQGDYENTIPEWRGSIEHVGSGERIFFRDLGAIGAFMNPYLESIGLDLGATFWERMSASITNADDGAPAASDPPQGDGHPPPGNARRK